MPVFAIFALCALTNGFAARLADPLVLPVSAHFMVAASLAAMLNTAYALPYAFAQPLLGPLGDRFSKERCIQICATGLGLSLALGAFAPSFGLLMASRIAAGIFAGGMTPLVLAALGDRYGMAERQVMIGRMLFAIIGGQMLGSAVSGFAEQAFGWRSALVIGAVMGISAAVFAWQGLRPAPIAPAADAAPKPSMRALYAKVFDNPTSLWLYGCVIFEGALFFGLFPFVGELLVHSTGAVATDVGRQTGLVLGAFGVGGLFYALLVRRVLRVMGMRRMCLIGSIVTALCYALLAVLRLWWLHALVMMLAGFTFYMVHNSLQTQATELAPSARGSAVALFAGGFFAGQGLGPLLVAPLLHAVGYQSTLVVLAVGLLLLGQVIIRKVVPAGG